MYKTLIANAIDKRLQQKVVNACDKLIVVSKYSETVQIDADKITIIPNGYDYADFLGKHPSQPKVFTITYTGTIAKNYPTKALINAIVGLPKNIKYLLRFVGKIDAEIAEHIKTEIGENVEFINFVPHAHAIDLMLSSSVLLLIIPDDVDNKFILTGKLFEYLRSMKPILILGPSDSVAADICQDVGSGITFEYEDIDGIQKYIIQKYYDYQNNITLDISPKSIEKYSRGALTKQLAKDVLL
jgi:glycosyltransferase involved in cell wall biosynthesis